MKLVKIISSVAALCCALSIMVDARADKPAVQDSIKRYHGFMYGDPRQCAWQACSIDDDCVVIDDVRCVGPVAVNRNSVVSAKKQLEGIGQLIDCVYAQRATPVDVECEHNRCQLKSNSGHNYCLQRRLSKEIISRCLASEPELCPEAAKRANVWSLQPGHHAILKAACDREHAPSCFELGSNHSNATEANRLLTRACELRFAFGCFQLGRRFGQDDPFNSWFYAACDIDSSVCMRIGQGLRKNDVASARSYWFKRGCDKGYAPSCDALESMEKELRAEQKKRESALERSLPVNQMTSAVLWDRVVRDNPEMEGATFLSAERPKPGYSLADYYIIRYSTKEGEIEHTVLPEE